MDKWVCYGGETTVLNIEGGDMLMQNWYKHIVGFLIYVNNIDGFQVQDNGYDYEPGVLITEGVSVSFNGVTLQIWSDEPGEIILVHRELSNNQSILVCNALGNSWKNFHV